RVEDTMNRLAAAYRLGSVEVVVFPTALFVSTESGETFMKRIRHRTVNLAVVTALNQLSRDVCAVPIPPEELRKLLYECRNRVLYSPQAGIGFAALAAAMMSQLEGGHFIDLIPAGITGAIVQLVRYATARIELPSSLGDLIAAAAAVLPALVFAQFKIFHPGAILVGGIMVLTPGLLITTAVRDGITGDLLSAVARLLEALLVGGAVAAGATLPLYIYLNMGGRWP
ncbi:MAG: threonine/serine exporter family protein, partial [Firmicutes bacterium]|nr:threonine/serine exporter family protein [Bacillota bacterium]